jgi:hypothetical protein
MTCEQATEAYKTARFAGATTAGLLEHAEACPRKRWTHALPSDLHFLARDNRARAEAFRLWESELA